MLVYCPYTVVYSTIPYEINGNCIDIMYVDVTSILRSENVFLRSSFAHVYISVGTFGGFAPPPPPPYQKADTGADCEFIVAKSQILTETFQDRGLDSVYSVCLLHF